MAATVGGGVLRVELRTPEGPVFSGDARAVSRIPATQGSMGVLPRHAPFLSSLELGLTAIEDQAGTTWRFVTGEGFVEVLDDQVLLLVDSAVDVSAIDIPRAEESAARARRRLAGQDPELSGLDEARAQGSLARALTRLRFARKS